MTCIVGVVEGGEVWIGGDSAGVSSWVSTIRADEKVFRSGEFLYGFTTSFRMGQLLRYKLEPPAIDTWDLRRYMATTFIDAVRSTLKDGGFLKKSSEQEEGGTFLVGVRGQLFKVCGDFQVGVAAVGYDACGCGQELALGALYATAGRPAPDRIETALRAAAHFSNGVRAPFVVERLPYTRG
jgi:ATP-dependent protease HslVU (ClpYQ) peptidase subunit